jgi:hypothetical protein
MNGQTEYYLANAYPAGMIKYHTLYIRIANGFGRVPLLPAFIF